MATLCSKSGPSSSSTTDSSTVGISMCWGHFSRHCPHWTHRDANSGSPRPTAPPSRAAYINRAVSGLSTRDRLLYSSKQRGIFTPAGHGIQYWQPVHPTFISSRYLLSTLFTSCSSASVSESGCASPATSRFSSKWASSFIPESTTVTSGWFHTQRSAHSAGDLFIGASSQISFTA